MATEQIIAAKTQLAVERLTKAQDGLQKLIGVEFEPQAITNKDKGVARFQQIENIAAFIEAVTEAVKAAKQDKAKDEKSEPKPEPTTLTAPDSPPVVIQQPKPATVTQPSTGSQKPGKSPPKRK